MINSRSKEMAIKLRKDGFTYSQILKQIPIAKSTLSLWLQSVGLSKKQKQRLTERKLAAMRRGSLKVREIRVTRTLQIKEKAHKEATVLIKDPLWLAGTLLYWAEGTKIKDWRPSQRVSFSNMDLSMQKIFIEWAKKYLGAKDSALRYEVYIHEGSDVNEAKSFWTRELKISNENPLRIYFKRNNPKTVRRNINESYKGVLTIWITRSTNLNRRIAGWIEGVIELLH